MADEAEIGESRGPVPAAPPTARTQRRAWLARRILDELILRGASSGDHVTEDALADALGVSRSPVRASFELLEGYGVLRHVRNRGFFLRDDVANFDGLIVSNGSSPEDALYAKILEDRLNDRLSGSVSQIELARRYDVPESRVGAVLARLREEGLVRRNPGRGWLFQPSLNTPETMAQSYAMRIAVEPAALRQPKLVIDRDALDLCRRRHDFLLSRAMNGPINQAQVFEVDSGFHEMLTGFSRNPYFLEAVRTQNRLRRMVEFVEYSDLARIEVWCLEHLKILEVVARGDIEEAAQLLTKHLVRASQSVGRR